MNKKMRFMLLGLVLLLAVGLLPSHIGLMQQDVPLAAPAALDGQYTKSHALGGELEPVGAPAGGAVTLELPMPEAPGRIVHKNASAQIDASNTQDGYVMVRHVGKSDKMLKVLITGPGGVTYTYGLDQQGEYETFPLSDGSGTYKIGVYRNISGTRYSTLLSKSVEVKLSDEFAPFLRPNQYVYYTPQSQAAALAHTLADNTETDYEMIEAVYSYVVSNISYDQQKARTVQSGYLPDVDQILEKKKGICFDYAALMSAMLRALGVPTKLVIGYTGDIYHAWISTYSAESGWIEGIIFFDGSSWKLMDPTFASSLKSNAKLSSYIGDGSSYEAKFLY